MSRSYTSSPPMAYSGTALLFLPLFYYLDHMAPRLNRGICLQHNYYSEQCNDRPSVAGEKRLRTISQKYLSHHK
jgi:hypothetical protein